MYTNSTNNARTRNEVRTDILDSYSMKELFTLAHHMPLRKMVDILGLSLESSGCYGYAVEETLKLFLKRKNFLLSGPNQTDLRRKCINYEVKTGSGELKKGRAKKMLSYCSIVIYFPVVYENLPLSRQEGFVIERNDFLEILFSLGLVREKIASDGVTPVTSIQTIYNRKQGKPHSKKKFDALLSLLYDNCIITFDEWLNENEKEAD